MVTFLIKTCFYSVASKKRKGEKIERTVQKVTYCDSSFLVDYMVVKLYTFRWSTELHDHCVTKKNFTLNKLCRKCISFLKISNTYLTVWSLSYIWCFFLLTVNVYKPFSYFQSSFFMNSSVLRKSIMKMMCFVLSGSSCMYVETMYIVHVNLNLSTISFLNFKGPPWIIKL